MLLAFLALWGRRGRLPGRRRWAAHAAAIPEPARTAFAAQRGVRSPVRVCGLGAPPQRFGRSSPIVPLHRWLPHLLEQRRRRWAWSSRSFAAWFRLRSYASVWARCRAALSGEAFAAAVGAFGALWQHHSAPSRSTTCRRSSLIRRLRSSPLIALRHRGARRRRGSRVASSGPLRRGPRRRSCSASRHD